MQLIHISEPSMRKAKKTETIDLSSDESDTSEKEVHKNSKAKGKTTQKEAEQEVEQELIEPKNDSVGMAGYMIDE